jgi:hypothetical protein
MDTHGTAQQAALASLLGFVNGVLDDNRGRWFRLCLVPSVYLLVDRRQGFVLIDELLRLSVAGLGAE